MLRSTYAQFVYVLGGADHDQMEKMRAFMSTLVAGWDVATVREIVADTLHNVVEPLVYDEAVSLIEEHKLAGRDIVIVSTSGTEVVEPIGAMLGADIVVASRLEEVDGKYTGNIDYYAYADEKASAIVELAEQRGYDLEASFAYSDSVTDLPMLEVVGHAHVVNPDKELRKVGGGPRVADPGLHQAGRPAQPGAGQADAGRARGRRRGRRRRRALGQRAAQDASAPEAAGASTSQPRPTTVRDGAPSSDRDVPPMRARPKPPTLTSPGTCRWHPKVRDLGCHR